MSNNGNPAPNNAPRDAQNNVPENDAAGNEQVNHENLFFPGNFGGHYEMTFPRGYRPLAPVYTIPRPPLNEDPLSREPPLPIQIRVPVQVNTQNPQLPQIPNRHEIQLYIRPCPRHHACNFASCQQHRHMPANVPQGHNGPVNPAEPRFYVNLPAPRQIVRSNQAPRDMPHPIRQQRQGRRFGNHEMQANVIPQRLNFPWPNPGRMVRVRPEARQNDQNAGSNQMGPGPQK